ncbi:hypothetical protein IAC76_05715 [Spirochaetes bacterium]|uniref:Uncharacterized protein n=1 Tax=Candidatus Scatousia excrementipullorum TaxID=2840936 RepID=A0A9D9GZJ6_9BACT|nr:hypothetical protein [Candidatus Scatousia excrementipullorum]
MVKIFVIVFGILLIQVLPAYSKTINGISTDPNVNKYVMSPVTTGKLYNNGYNTRYYMNGIGSIKTVEIEDDGKKIIYTETVPNSSRFYGGGPRYGSYRYQTKPIRSHNSVGVGSGLKIRF